MRIESKQIDVFGSGGPNAMRIDDIVENCKYWPTFRGQTTMCLIFEKFLSIK